ncbi:MAG: DUF4169 family protein [Hyphomicrobiaceae bacterium]|nr:DUF4169 family protein [Hyphomicrobiaceae bacterium]
MSADILSLSKARKAKQRAGKDKTAAENRRRHGRTKAERDADKARADQDARRHEALRLTPRETSDSGTDGDGTQTP